MHAGLTITIVFIVLVLIYISAKKRNPTYRVAPARVFKEELNLTAENISDIKINPENVPAHLQDLIPMAEKWGIGDDIIRDDFGDKASQEEKEELKKMLTGRTKEVDSWLDSFGDDMTDDAVPFMYMLSALDEMSLWPD